MKPTADEKWMREALVVAEEGLQAGELPIGALVVVDDDVVGRAHTQEVSQARLLVHAELLALDQADRRLGNRRNEASLYTTLEPCLGCFGAAMTVMVGTIVYGLESPSDGAIRFAERWNRERKPEAFPGYRYPAIRGGILRAESASLFNEYVNRHASGGTMVEWARTLAAS